MSVTETDVRNYLDAMPTDRVSTETVVIQLRLATNYVNVYKGSGATAEQIWGAILTRAGWLTYQAYATEFERASSRMPGPIVLHLVRYEEIADQFLQLVKSGVAPAGLISLATLREHQIDVAGVTIDRLEAEE